MVNNKQSVQAIDTLINNVPNDAEQEKILTALINEGGISLDHESLRVSGTYAHAARVAASLEVIAARIPVLLKEVWEVQGKSQIERDTKVVDALRVLLTDIEQKNKDAVQKIDVATNRFSRVSYNGARNTSKYVLCSLSGLTLGLISTLLFSIYFIFPRYLHDIRAEDVDVLEWLKTDNGQLLYQSFRAGGLQNCSLKVVKAVKTVNCQIESR